MSWSMPTPDEPAKQRRAIGLIRDLRARGEAVLSTQVLQEWVNVALRKLRLPPSARASGLLPPFRPRADHT